MKIFFAPVLMLIVTEIATFISRENLSVKTHSIKLLIDFTD